MTMEIVRDAQSLRRVFAAGLTLAFAGAALHATRAHAQDAPDPVISFSGYGTVGVVRSDENRADYIVDAFKPNGPGRSHGWSGDVDSRLGGQVTATFSPRVSAVIQVIAQQRYDDTYRPTVEWANLKLQITPELSIRGGRVVLPVFMVTDTRRVGYANPWVRPPVEVYSMVPVSNSDGVDLNYRMVFGPVTNNVQFTAGRSNSQFPNSAEFGSGTAQVREILAVNDTWEMGYATGRLSYGRARLTIPEFAPLFDGFRQFGPQGAALANRYNVDNRLVTFVGVGASYDPGTWFVMGEWARFDTDSVVGAKVAWYASGGYRFGKFTPYATYARIKPDSPTSDPGISLLGLPPQLAAVAAQLNGILNIQLRSPPHQDTVSVGVRWDFVRNASLKLQYDRVSMEPGSFGTFGNRAPNYPPGGRVGIFSAAVDFVF
jgi:hypothetical protein